METKYRMILQLLYNILKHVTIFFSLLKIFGELAKGNVSVSGVWVMVFTLHELSCLSCLSLILDHPYDRQPISGIILTARQKDSSSILYTMGSQ